MMNLHFCICAILKFRVCAIVQLVKIHRLGMHQQKVWCNWCNWCNWCTDDGAHTVCCTKVLKSDSGHCNIVKSNNIHINVSVPPKSSMRVVGYFLGLKPWAKFLDALASLDFKLSFSE